MKLIWFILIFFISLNALMLSQARPQSQAKMPDPTYVTQLIETAQKSNLANDIQWLNLGHYKKNLFSGYESQVDGMAFFIDPNGKDDPQAELTATIRGFFSTTINKDTKMEVRCQFPARFIWLQKVLNIDEKKLPAINCDRYEKYKEQLSANSATLVFSSFFLNNPSSAFGHSFIRINSSKSGVNGEHNELLDHGINFGAVITTGNPVIYAVGGLMGIFKGTFVNVPYFYKVREYNDYEARDLWSYDLALTPDEIKMLVAHIWELGSTYYDYFYFTENCSYHMFTTLDAAAPRLNLTELLPYDVIPSDTVRKLVTVPGLVTKISYRPSNHTQFVYRLKDLNPAQVKVLKKFVAARHQEDLLIPFSPQEQAQILDAATDYIDFKFAGDLMKDHSEAAQWKQDILRQRAQLGIQSPELNIPAPEADAPHEGHGLHRVVLGAGLEAPTNPYYVLGFRFAMHDLLDPGPGYPPGGQIEMFTGQIRYLPNPNNLQIDFLTFLRIVSLSPIDAFTKNISFKVDVGAKKITDQNCNQCVAGNIEGGPGIDFQPFGTDKIDLFSFADFQIAYAPAFLSSSFRLGGGPSAGMLVRFTPNFKALVTGIYRYQLFSTYPNTFEGNIDLRYGIGKEFALDLAGSAYPTYSEASFSAMYYY